MYIVHATGRQELDWIYRLLAGKNRIRSTGYREVKNILASLDTHYAGYWEARTGLDNFCSFIIQELLKKLWTFLVSSADPSAHVSVKPAARKCGACTSAELEDTQTIQKIK